MFAFEIKNRNDRDTVLLEGALTGNDLRVAFHYVDDLEEDAVNFNGAMVELSREIRDDFERLASTLNYDPDVTSNVANRQMRALEVSIADLTEKINEE